MSAQPGWQRGPAQQHGTHIHSASEGTACARGGAMCGIVASCMLKYTTETSAVAGKAYLEYHHHTLVQSPLFPACAASCALSSSS